MNCPDCQRRIPSDSLYCCYCGQSLRRCEECELFFDERAAFCGSCGSPLETQRASSTGEFPAPSQTLNSSQPPATGSVSDALGDDTIGYLHDSNDESKRYFLSLGDNTVGAGANNDIIINRPAVSWNHAILICRGGRVLVQDSASTNGTFVNDDFVRSPCHLEHGEEVRFGSENFQLWLRPSFRQSTTD